MGVPSPSPQAKKVAGLTLRKNSMCKEGMGYGTRVNTERNENHKKNNNAQFFKFIKFYYLTFHYFKNINYHYITLLPHCNYWDNKNDNDGNECTSNIASHIK